MDGMVVFVPLGNQHHGRSRYRTPVLGQLLALRRDRVDNRSNGITAIPAWLSMLLPRLHRDSRFHGVP